ncbi:MAG: hypothetical protein WBE06_01905 [Phycisphaerae bacterium]
MKSATRQPGVRGAALLLVIFAVAFVAVLSIAVLDVMATDLGVLRNHASGLRALYAAEAGVGHAIAELRDKYDSTSTVEGTLTSPSGATCRYRAEIDNAKPVVTVTSTGVAGGFVRTVRARLIVAGPPMAKAYPVRIVWWREVAGVALLTP